MLIVGKAVCAAGTGIYGKSLNFLLNFAVNLKLLRKKVYLKGQKFKNHPCLPRIARPLGREGLGDREGT